MGVVVQAYDTVIERPVAIKTIQTASGGDAESEHDIVRFRQEAKAAGRLAHPNIVAVYDLVEDGGKTYLVMELVEGASLRRLIHKGTPFDLGAVGAIMLQLLGALEYSHSRGIIHRDIKPANLMLTGTGHIKVADFGLARIDQSNLTHTGELIGTPAYMAPEQVRGNSVDHRCDIYAAGVLFFELLTGARPFLGSLPELMHKILTDPIPMPSQRVQGLPAVLDAVVAKALARRKEDRYPTAAAFATALKTAYAGFRPLDSGTWGGTAVSIPATARKQGIGTAAPAAAAPAPAPAPEPEPEPAVETMTASATAPTLTAPSRPAGPSAQTASFGRRAIIFRQGDPAPNAYIVTRGMVDISFIGTDKPVFVARLGPGEIFGELAVVGGTAHGTNATTEDGCELKVVSASTIQGELKRLDPFLNYWVVFMAGRLSSVLSRLEWEEGGAARAAAAAAESVVGSAAEMAVGSTTARPGSAPRAPLAKPGPGPGQPTYGNNPTIVLYANDVLFRQGDPGLSAYLVRSGRVEISTGTGATRTVLTVMKKDQIFGELALIDHQPRSATAMALEKTELMVIDGQKFKERLDRQSEFVRYWAKVLARRLRDLSRRLG